MGMTQGAQNLVHIMYVQGGEYNLKSSLHLGNRAAKCQKAFISSPNQKNALSSLYENIQSFKPSFKPSFQTMRCISCKNSPYKFA